jgi:predicted RNA-binding Zn-ribbon protein involved in translation (DUF1610 family)
MPEIYPPVLSRTLILNKKKIDAISELFDLDPKTITRLFQNERCSILFCSIRARGKKRAEAKEIPRKKYQAIPGPNSKQLKYMCQGPNCKKFRYLEYAQARRIGFKYYCPRCAQLYKHSEGLSSPSTSI